MGAAITESLEGHLNFISDIMVSVVNTSSSEFGGKTTGPSLLVLLLYSLRDYSIVNCTLVILVT